MSPPRSTSPLRLRPVAARALLAAACGLAAAGCRIDVIRTRAGRPLDTAAFEQLEVAKTTRREAVDRLGAPEKVEWKNGRDFLWYLYQDTLDTGIRFQFPPFRSSFGYQHTFLRLNEKADDTNAMQLVFDDQGVLEQKSLRLTKALEPEEKSAKSWRLHLDGHFDYSFALQGDGGVADYDELFHNGFRAGLTAGYQPVPVLTFLAGANYQEYQGQALHAGGSRLTLDDLQLVQAVIGIRLSAPLSLLWEFTDYETVKKVLFTEDLEGNTGLRLYVEGTTGATYNSKVEIKEDAIPGGDLYDAGIGFSGTIEAGIEYEFRHGAVHVGVLYQGLDAFEEGGSGFDDEGNGMGAFLVGGGAALKF